MRIIEKRKHGKVCAYPPENPLGYFGWPSAAMSTDGTLLAAGSGFRNAHVCPFGKTVIFRSKDNGETWSAPQIAVTSEIDVRDPGLTPLSGGRFLLSYFTSDTRLYYTNGRSTCPKQLDFGSIINGWSDDMVKREFGSFTRILEADGSVGPRRAAPVSAPHGPIMGKDQVLYYAGAVFGLRTDDEKQNISTRQNNARPVIALYKSTNEGESWEPVMEEIPLTPPHESMVFCEPHLIEKKNGGFLLFLRGEEGQNLISVWQSESDPSGKIWSEPVRIASGAPPHVIRHSSGVLILSAGYRREPFGEMVSFSTDDGKTWDSDYYLHDDGICSDLGYPTTVELPDGSLFSAYYQSPAHFTPPGILCTKWELPDQYKQK